MNASSPLALLAILFSAVSVAWAQPAPCDVDVYAVYQREPVRPSWVFNRSTYTHDPFTGARVAQYQRLPAIEPLDDPRMITSRYRRVRTNLRGTDGSIDSTYETQSWGNGRGGLDAEWERFHDAWKESYLTGGFYNQQNPGFGGGFPGWGWGNGFPQGGFPNGGFPNGGFPNGGWAPNQGFPPGQGFPHGNGQSPHGGPWQDNWPQWNGGQGNGPRGGGPHGGGNHHGPNGNEHADED